jgi:uncharacterized membrane protein YkvA (DUF1232 family)
MWSSVRQWARAIKRDTLATYLAVRDARTPWYAKTVGLVVVAYALSPIDLIPDFIPIVGYLDDVVLVPLGLWMVIRLIPNAVMADCRARAEAISERPVSRVAAAVIVAIWLAAAILAGGLLITAAGR